MIELQSSHPLFSVISADSLQGGGNPGDSMVMFFKK